MNNLYDYIQIDSLICEVYQNELDMICSYYPEVKRVRQHNDIQIAENILDDLKKYIFAFPYEEYEEISLCFKATALKFGILLGLKKDLAKFSEEFGEIKTDKNLTELISQEFVSFLLIKLEDIVLECKKILKEFKFSFVKRGFNNKIVRAMNGFLDEFFLSEKIDFLDKIAELIDYAGDLSDQEIEKFNNMGINILDFLDEWLMLSTAFQAIRSTMDTFARRFI
ncbi:hypothetical protein NX779_01370 [Mycoplasma cottewii]|uniref:Phosphate transport system protein PhoU n=1 Tax=Mycoplasma cottewii TaxID=51364 RepID=A0ABY5TX64_9MOLU|nr:hypothetical protein [Mycoplasma cottewii]UWD35270.1 hypothetical protein NX779_01370 [Mycoplasma cottewii]